MTIGVGGRGAREPKQKQHQMVDAGFLGISYVVQKVKLKIDLAVIVIRTAN